MTLFEEIVNGTRKVETLYEDEKTIVINDIKPQAPIHVLVIPKKISYSIEDADLEIISDCFNTIKKISKLLKIEKNGYRVVTNVGNNGGQSIKYLHFHILGGKRVSSKIA